MAIWRAMIDGVTGSQFCPAESIRVSARDRGKLLEFVAPRGLRLAETNEEVVQDSDIIVLAVKPQQYEEVIRSIAPHLRKRILISIAPGKSLKQLEEWCGGPSKIVRAMPNTPVAVGEGMSALCRSAEVTDAEMEIVSRMFASFGRALVVEESRMNAVVAVSGSSPAYVFVMLEAMADAAVRLGMDRAQAYTFASQAVLGAAKMVLDSGIHPGVLKDQVCSPGGTTIEAVRELERSGFRTALIEAMIACGEKSGRM